MAKKKASKARPGCEYFGGVDLNLDVYQRRLVWRWYVVEHVGPGLRLRGEEDEVDSAIVAESGFTTPPRRQPPTSCGCSGRIMG